MKYTLSYLIRGGRGYGGSSWISNSDEEAIKKARKSLAISDDRILRFTPILSCGETQHNLLPYYPHDDEMNYYDRRSGKDRRVAMVIVGTSPAPEHYYIRRSGYTKNTRIATEERRQS